MKQIFVCVALLGLIFAPPSLAQETQKYSPAYYACGELPQICTENELEVQDARLNAAYKAAMSTLAKDRQNELRGVQRSWIKFRDDLTNYMASEERGHNPTIMAMEANLRMTYDQANFLEGLIQGD
jgi:uncharacterized protein YecT (DUF1311 family)